MSTELQSEAWHEVDELEQVAGASLRAFYVDIPSETVRPVLDGIYSPDCIEHEGVVLLYTSYTNLRRRVQRALCPEDGRQIWLDLELQRDASTAGIAGLVSCEHRGWQVGDDEQGSYWGAHVYDVRFLASGFPNS